MPNRKIEAQVIVVSQNGPPTAKLICVKLPNGDGRPSAFIEVEGTGLDLMHCLSEIVTALVSRSPLSANAMKQLVCAAVDMGLENAATVEGCNDTGTN